MGKLILERGGADTPVCLSRRAPRRFADRKVHATNRGFTLLECLIVVMLGSLLAVGTMRVLGDSAMVRSNARDRLALATIAQSELDKLRAIPADEVQQTTQTLTSPEWPEGVELQVATTAHSPGILQIELLATRRSIEGKPSVRLATLRRGMGP